MTKPTAAATEKNDQQELAELLKRAASMPGVAEVMELAQMHARTLQATQQFTTGRIITFSSSDGSVAF